MILTKEFKYPSIVFLSIVAQSTFMIVYQLIGATKTCTLCMGE